MLLELILDLLALLGRAESEHQLVHGDWNVLEVVLGSLGRPEFNELPSQFCEGLRRCRDHMEIPLGKLQFQFVVHGLLVLVYLGDCIRRAAVLLKPFRVVDLLHYTEHLCNLLDRHADSVFIEEVLHLLHVDRIRAVCVQFREHLVDLSLARHFCGKLLVNGLYDVLLRFAPCLTCQPAFYSIRLQNTPHVWVFRLALCRAASTSFERVLLFCSNCFGQSRSAHVRLLSIVTCCNLREAEEATSFLISMYQRGVA